MPYASDGTGEAGGEAAVDGYSAEVDGNLCYSLELKSAAFSTFQSPLELFMRPVHAHQTQIWLCKFT
jgi:hypothetical protein